MTANDTQPDLMTPDEAAEALRLDAVSKDPRRTVMNMARDGILESRRIGKWVMITRASIDTLRNGEVTHGHDQPTTTTEAGELPDGTADMGMPVDRG